MPGFGKKNRRGTDLRKLMIVGAAHVFRKEIALSGRPPSSVEIASIITSLCSKHKLTLSEAEFSSVTTGTTRLAKNRRYIEEILARWSRGRASLEYEDLRKAGELLNGIEGDATARG
jgi:hypothetical protein